MTILSDRDIHDRQVTDTLITPLGEGCLQPSSVDLRLGPKLLIATPTAHRRHAGGRRPTERDDGGGSVNSVDTPESVCASILAPKRPQVQSVGKG